MLHKIKKTKTLLTIYLMVIVFSIIGDDCNNKHIVNWNNTFMCGR